MSLFYGNLCALSRGVENHPLSILKTLLHKRAHIGRIFHMIELNSKQRKILEKAAHDLEPVVIIGGRGLSEGVVQMTDSQLKMHELIKVCFNEFKDEKKELAKNLADQCNATLVRLIGNRAILYREAEESEKRAFEKLLLRAEKH